MRRRTPSKTRSPPAPSASTGAASAFCWDSPYLMCMVALEYEYVFKGSILIIKQLINYQFLIILI